jgi:dihydropteroate synthase
MARLERPVDLALPTGTVRLGAKPLLMGILNVTPDSFSDGGRHFALEDAVRHGETLAAEGADWIDVGGESTRPGATPVPEDEELRRVIPVVQALAERCGKVISIDTYKPRVAAEAVQAGAAVVNDVTGFRDPRMIEVAAACRAACVVMHLRGTPADMMNHVEYDDVLAELDRCFAERLAALEAAGVARTRVVLDPGIGFAKRSAHNLAILRRLDRFHAHGRPILLGASRKRIVGDLTGRPESGRLAGTIATTILSWQKGVQMFRVHDVAAMVDALAVAQAIDAQHGGYA